MNVVFLLSCDIFTKWVYWFASVLLVVAVLGSTLGVGDYVVTASTIAEFESAVLETHWEDCPASLSSPHIVTATFKVRCWPVSGGF